MASVHCFWNTKPLQVAPLNEHTFELIQTSHGFEDTSEPVSEALEWATISNIEVESASAFIVIDEYHAFLKAHYKTPHFPFQIVYTIDHLRMEMKRPYWLVLLRSKKLPGKPIMAGIFGSVRSFLGRNQIELKDVLSIGFLCIHASLRHLGLAPRLIHEISRQANRSPLEIQRAYYNSATRLPGAFCATWNYHFILNWDRCRAVGYIPIDATPPRLSVQTKMAWRFEWVQANPDATMIHHAVNLVNGYNQRHRKLWMQTSDEDWVYTHTKSRMHTESHEICFVYKKDGNASEPIGVIMTVSHPYQKTNDMRLHTVLLYHYGFAQSLNKAQERSIWMAFLRHATPSHWDVFTTTQPELWDAVPGFEKGHVYYHYMYNVRMCPMNPADITMVGV